MERYIEFASNHWILVLALAVVTFFLIQDLIESALQKFKSISPTLAVALMNQDETVILDVRDENEFKNGHIANAVNIPLSKLDKQFGELEKYKDLPLIVACQTGSRSGPACKKLSQKGFRKLNNLAGGIQSWEDYKLPLVKN